MPTKTKPVTKTTKPAAKAAKSTPKPAKQAKKVAKASNNYAKFAAVEKEMEDAIKKTLHPDANKGVVEPPKSNSEIIEKLLRDQNYEDLEKFLSQLKAERYAARLKEVQQDLNQTLGATRASIGSPRDYAAFSAMMDRLEASRSHASALSWFSDDDEDISDIEDIDPDVDTNPNSTVNGIVDQEVNRIPAGAVQILKAAFLMEDGTYFIGYVAENDIYETPREAVAAEHGLA